MPAALAGLAPEVIAMLALLAVLAAYFLSVAIVNILKALHIDALPLVGGAIVGAFEHLADAIAGAATWLWQHVNPINWLIAAVHWLFSNWASAIAHITSDIYNAIMHVVVDVVPRWISQAVNTSIGLFNEAEAYAASLYNAAVAVATNLVAIAIQRAADLFNSAVAFTWSVFATVENDIRAAVGAATAWASAAIAAAYAGAIAAVSGAIGYAEHLFSTAITYVDARVGDVTKWIDTVIVPALAALGVSVAALETDWANWRTKCGDPLCNNLSGFGNVINALEQLGIDALVVALIAECVANPQGVADDVVSIVRAPVVDLYNVIAGQTGLQAA